MKRLVYFPVLAIFMLSSVISCKQTPKSQVIDGIVYDASMNNITVISNQGDTVNISTMNSNPQKVPGVLLNDSVQVTCIEENVDGTQILKAVDLTITVHSPYYYIQGTWVEPNPINAKEEQGFTLNADGTANSINMATLLIKGWNLNDKVLQLNYESIGNKQTIQGIDTLNIVKIDADSLVLEENGAIVWRLARKK